MGRKGEEEEEEEGGFHQKGPSLRGGKAVESLS